VGTKKGGKAKPLSAKVSTEYFPCASRNALAGCEDATGSVHISELQHMRQVGIDCAALFTGPVEAAAEAARGSVSLDSMYLRLGS
jgi:hypothetical protein